MRFPSYKVVHGDHRHSNHRPVIVDTHDSVRVRNGLARGSMPHFEARWLEEEASREIVKHS
jgi:hypothetical protein